MKCKSCKFKKPKKDFLMGNKECYKCVYEKKLKNIKSVNICRICEKPCDSHRWVYCSAECSRQGDIQNNKDYWVKLVKKV